MPYFTYKARDRFSRPVSGTTEAPDKGSVAKKLKEMGYTPITIEEGREPGPDGVVAKFRRVKLEELDAFTRQLYAMQKAGVPLLSSLEAVSQEIKNKYFKMAVTEVIRDIRSGSSFSASLRKHPRVFNDVYTGMIKAAETSGTLTNILERLNGLIEQEIDTRARIKAATRYPMIAFVVLLLGFLVVVAFVIPRFAVIYSQFNTLLPLPTRILIGTYTILRKYWYLVIAGLGASAFLFLRCINSRIGRPIWDNIKLNVPVFGPLIKMLAMSRFARVTAIMMRSGVPILEVLDLVGGSAGNVIISRAIVQIKESVNQGKGISEPMKIMRLFPSAVIQMVSVGEQTGKVDELLLSVSDYYDRESGYTIKNLTTYIEPLLIFVLACMLLVMALAIFLPMWNLIRVFRGT